MTKHLDVWFDTLTEARKQFLLARGSYEMVFRNLLKRKCDQVIEGLTGKVLDVPSIGKIHPSCVFMDYFWSCESDFDVEPGSSLYIGLVRDIDDIDTSGFSTKELTLFEKVRKIYETIDFRYLERVDKHEDALVELRGIQHEFMKHGRNIFLVDRPLWFLDADDIFDENFIGCGFSYCGTNILESENGHNIENG